MLPFPPPSLVDWPFHVLSPRTLALAPSLQPQSQGPGQLRGREQHRDAESLDTCKEVADALAVRYRTSPELLDGVGTCCGGSCGYEENTHILLLFCSCCRFLDR
jgi:hypothetical protein